MPVIINGSTGISGTDGSAATPAVQGTDTNTGMFFPAADTIAFSEGGVEAMRIDASGNVGIGNTVPGVNDVIGDGRPLLVTRGSTSTTIAGSTAAVVIGNADTTTNNTSQLSFAAITGASTTYFTSATISCVFGARTNAQYPTGELVFSTSSTLNSAPTEKARITAAGNFQFNSGYGSVATAYGCRAWVNFNGTGTVAIRASGNVSSITDNGTGDYTVNFTAAMPDANYSVVVTGTVTLGSFYGTGAINGNTAPAAGSVRVFSLNNIGGAAASDPAYFCVTILR